MNNSEIIVIYDYLLVYSILF